MELPDRTGAPKQPQIGPLPPSREKKEPIVTGAKKVRRPITRRVFGFIFCESPKSAVARIGSDVLLPQMKMGLEAAAHAFLHNLFWSNDANRPMSPMVTRATLLGQRPNTNYGLLSTVGQQQQLQQAHVQERSTGNYTDLTLPRMADAQELLARMLDYLSQYPVVAVADLYEWADILTAPSDNSFGWSDLSTARIVPVSGGFRLELPRPTLL